MNILERLEEIKEGCGGKRACPHCANDYMLTIERVGWAEKLHEAGCGQCLAQGPITNNEDEARTAWNNRPIEDELITLVESLLKEKDEIRRETTEKCVSFVVGNTPMEGCHGCVQGLVDGLRSLAEEPT